MIQFVIIYSYQKGGNLNTSNSKTRWLILSDIHGNMEALLACLEKAKEIGYDRIACLGDLVGYGPEPNEVVDWIKGEKDAVCVCGNHDRTIADISLSVLDYTPLARKSMELQRKLVNESSREFLLSLPEFVIVNYLHFVHGSPLLWDDYILRPSDAWAAMPYVKGDICFIGHTHSPRQWKDDDGNIRIVNVGSVGQPRDENPHSSFVIFDEQQNKIDNIRVKYDIEKVQEKMKKLNISDVLIKRLRYGM